MPITVAETSVTVVFHRSLCCFPHLPSAKSTSCQNLQLHLGSFYNAVMCYRYKNIFAYVLFITVNKMEAYCTYFLKLHEAAREFPVCQPCVLWNPGSCYTNVDTACCGIPEALTVTPLSPQNSQAISVEFFTVYIEIGFLCFPARSM